MLTNASAVALRYFMESPKAGLTSVTPETSDPRLTVALFGCRVTCCRVRAQPITFANRGTASVLIALSSRLAIGTTPFD